MKHCFDNRIVSAALLAVSIVILGFCVKWGIDDFANKDRKVSVKGLSEREVDADKVTWPILSKELGNNLPELYNRIAVTQGKIKKFLMSNGVKENEINVNAPVVIDLNADQYNTNQRAYRYNITSIVTVTSRNVKLVRSIIARQGELLKEGIAIVDGGYENPVKYEFVSFNSMKPKMMEEAIANARKTAEQRDHHVIYCRVCTRHELCRVRQLKWCDEEVNSCCRETYHDHYQ